MKRIASLMLAALMLISLVALCSCEKEDDTFTICTNAEFPPFEYVLGDQVAGVDIDIAQAIADELGQKLEVKNVKFDTIIGAVKSGKCDMGIAGMTVTDERMEEVDFSVSYITSTQYIVTAKDVEVTSIMDLAGKKIGVQTGTTGDFIISDETSLLEDEEGNAIEGVIYNTGAEVLRYNSAIEAGMALASGKIDAVVVDKLPAQNIATTQDLVAVELVYEDGSNTEESYAACVQKGNTELLETINKVMQKLIDEGKIDEFVINHTANTTITE